jgi:predicted transcriptional regulator
LDTRDSSKETKKVTVNLPEETIDTLRRLAEERNTTMTEVLKSAVNTESFLSRRIVEGATVLLKERDNSTRELVFVTPEPQKPR